MLIYKTIEKKDLRYALSNKEFFLAFQPIINLKSDSFETFEAFIRWHHPVLGALPPTIFMNLIFFKILINLKAVIQKLIYV